MEYASPTVQLLGLVTAILVGLIQITAAVVFLLQRQKSAGPWIMLAGAILSLIGIAVPQAIYLYTTAATVSDLSPQVESVMYLTVWNWLGISASLLFAIGLLLTAVQRRALPSRIAELEALLQNIK